MEDPTVGRIVHYVSHGTPGGEYGKKCRAAIVTQAPPNGFIGLCVLSPSGMLFDGAVPYSSGEEAPGDPDCPNIPTHGDPFRYCACGWVEATLTGGTWHWPERIGEEA